MAFPSYKPPLHSHYPIHAPLISMNIAEYRTNIVIKPSINHPFPVSQIIGFGAS
jgi:hypothetical protein